MRQAAKTPRQIKLDGVQLNWTDYRDGLPPHFRSINRFPNPARYGACTADAPSAAPKRVGPYSGALGGVPWGLSKGTVRIRILQNLIKKGSANAVSWGSAEIGRACQGQCWLSACALLAWPVLLTLEHRPEVVRHACH